MSRRSRQGRLQPYIPVVLAELAVAHWYGTLDLGQVDRQQLRQRVEQELQLASESAQTDVTQQQRRIQRLLAEQQRLTQAVYDQLLPAEVIRNEHSRIDLELTEAKEMLVESIQYQNTTQAQSQQALKLATTLDLKQAYLSASPLIQRFLNQAMVVSLFVDDHGDGTREGHGFTHDVKVTGAEFHPEINLQRLTQAILALSVNG